MTPYAPCPSCNATNSKQAGFTWWGGILGPKLLNHVKCQTCGTAYNGKSGESNRAKITLYVVVTSLAVLVLMIILGIFAFSR